MFKIKNQNGFAHLLIAVGILVLISAGGVGYYVYTSQIKNGQNTTKNMPSNDACNQTGNISVCLRLDNINIEYGQPIKTKTIIKNVGAVDYNTEFSCTDTTPSFIIDGKNRMGLTLCGQAITEVKLKPNEIVAHEESLPGDYLKPGEYEIQTKWSGNLSGKIRISIKPQPAGESERLNQACLKGEYSTNCSYIEIISVEGEDNPTSCDALYKMYDIYGMGKIDPNNTSVKNDLCDMGIITYIVPDANSAEYVKKLENDPTVESVSSDE